MLYEQPEPGRHIFRMEEVSAECVRPKIRRQSSGVRGVTWDAKNQKWRAQVNGKYLGIHATVAQAAEAVRAYRRVM